MSIVNFSIPEVLDKKVERVIEEKGFASKAEFFRFSAIYFMEIVDKPEVNEEERFYHFAKVLSSKIKEKYRGKDIPPLEEQLADL